MSEDAAERGAGETDPDLSKAPGGLLESLAGLDLGETLPADVFDPRWDA